MCSSRGVAGEAGRTSLRRPRPPPASYDLSPANDHLWGLGLGMFHSGVEVDGVEYSFGDQGGIFTQPPRQTPNAPLRETVDLGESRCGRQHVGHCPSPAHGRIARQVHLHGDPADRRLDATAVPRRQLPHHPQVRCPARCESLHALRASCVPRRNCNSFTKDLCARISEQPAPSYVNRMADIGSCFSCLIPDSVGRAPVNEAGGGDGGSGVDFATAGGGSYRGTATQGSAGAGPGPSRAAPRFSPFAGTGFSLRAATSSMDGSGRYQPVRSSEVEEEETPGAAVAGGGGGRGDPQQARREAVLRAALRRQQEADGDR